MGGRVWGEVRPSSRGLTFVALGVGMFGVAYLAGLPALLPVASLLLGLPVVAVAFVRLAAPRVSVSRTFSPPSVGVGQVSSVAVTVRNLSWRRSAVASWWDTLPWRPGATDGRVLPALEARSARSARTLAYDLVPPRRGVFAIGPLSVAVVDPFGLATRTVVVGGEQSFVVTPEVVALADTGLSLPAGDGVSRLVQRRAAGDDDDSITREYRRGDAMRRVHWRASARHGDLMVRQEEQRSFPEARIIVETRRAGFVDAKGEGADHDSESESFEWVVRMLASVAVHLRRQGFVVTVVETGPQQLEEVGRDRRHTWGEEEFLAALATLSLTGPVLGGLLDGGLHADGQSGGPVIALLGDPDAETFEWLLGQRQQGELAVAFLARGYSAIETLDRSFGEPAGVPPLAERLADAGWLVIAVRADDDHAVAWQTVVAETGRARDIG